jgi:hypothetical protein
MVTFEELIESEAGCRFPLDDVYWCGAATIEGESWCPMHRRRVFLPPQRIPRRLQFDQEPPVTALDEIRDTWRRVGSAP